MQSFIVKMSRKVDTLQSYYGVPSCNRSLEEDIIECVFSTLWENILHFKHNVNVIETAKNGEYFKETLSKKTKFEPGFNLYRLEPRSIKTKTVYIETESCPTCTMEWDSFIPGYGYGEWGGPGYGDREDTPSHVDVNGNDISENVTWKDDEYVEDYFIDDNNDYGVDVKEKDDHGEDTDEDVYNEHAIIYDQKDEYTDAVPVDLTAEAQYFEDLYHQACFMTDDHEDGTTCEAVAEDMVYSDYEEVGLQHDDHDDGMAYYDSSSDDGLWSWCD